MAFQYGIRLPLHDANHMTVTNGSSKQPKQCATEEIATRISGVLSRTNSGDHELFPSNPPSSNALSEAQGPCDSIQQMQEIQNLASSITRKPKKTYQQLMEISSVLIQQSPSHPEFKARAFTCAIQAAKSEQPTTLIYLAFFYAVGFNGHPDPASAFDLLKRSFHLDPSPKSALILGRMFETGFGVTEDYIMALRIYSDAKSRGAIFSNHPVPKHISSIFPEEWRLFKDYVPLDRAIFS